MTVTRDQATILAELARACRPNGAARWDTAGIIAAIGQVKDKSLGEVILATIRAACDRDVDSPGVIPTAGSHWAESASVRTTAPEILTREERCSICSLSEAECRRRWAKDRREPHEFLSVAAAAQIRLNRPPEAVHRTVAALKDELAPTAPPPPPRGLDALTERRPELAEAAERIAQACPGLRNEPNQPEEVER